MAFSENSIIKLSELRDAIYPIGSIYLSVNNTNPETFFGGTWDLLPENYALWTCSDNGGTTIPAGLPNIKGEVHFGRMPRHMHDTVSYNGAFTQSSTGIVPGWADADINRTTVDNLKFDASDSNSIYSDSVTTVQPPAYRVYAWKRKS